MMGLYDVSNTNNKYYYWNFNQFFNLNVDIYLSSCSYEIFELKKGLAYIIVFIPKDKINVNISRAIFIKKFGFKSFDQNAFDELDSITFEGFENKKILSVFLIDDDNENNGENNFVVLTYDEDTGRRRNSKIIPPGDWLLLRKTTNYVFNLKFYKNTITEAKDMEINDGFFATHYHGEKLFIKSFYLNDGHVAFIYYKEDVSDFYVELFKLNYKESTNYISSKTLEKSQIISDKPFSFESLNDFVKINNKKLAFIYTSSSYTCILIININENRNLMNITNYYIDFNDFQPTNQISGFSYNNDYLLLTTTAMPKNQPNSDLPDYLSIFMIFGYAT